LKNQTLKNPQLVAGGTLRKLNDANKDPEEDNIILSEIEEQIKSSQLPDGTMKDEEIIKLEYENLVEQAIGILLGSESKSSA